MIETILQGLICDKQERTLRAEVLGDVAAPGWCAPGDAGQVGADGAARTEVACDVAFFYWLVPLREVF